MGGRLLSEWIVPRVTDAERCLHREGSATAQGCHQATWHAQLGRKQTGLGESLPKDSSAEHGCVPCMPLAMQGLVRNHLGPLGWRSSRSSAGAKATKQKISSC